MTVAMYEQNPMDSSGSEFCTKPDCVGNRSSPSSLPQCYDFFLFRFIFPEPSKILLTSKSSMLNSHIYSVDIRITLFIISLQLAQNNSPAQCGDFSEVSYFTRVVNHDRILIRDILGLKRSVSEDSVGRQQCYLSPIIVFGQAN